MNTAANSIVSISENLEVKFCIQNVLVKNGFLAQEDGTDCFTYKVIRSKWVAEDDVYNFEFLTDHMNNRLEESDEERLKLREHYLSKECFAPLTPRLVLVNYTENRGMAISPGNNMYPPIGNFVQKGMVINLETQEVLCPGTSWINTIFDTNELMVLAADTVLGNHLQQPIEGATVSMFYYPEADEIFLGTNRRVLKLSKIIIGGGSRWNFYGAGAVDESLQSMFPLTSNNQLQFDIHRGALHVILEVAMDNLGIEDFVCDTVEETIEFVKNTLKIVFFPPGNENVVYGGILSGKPFANQSKVLSAAEYDHLTFTLNSVARRTLDKETGKTLWNESNKSHWFELFQSHSQDITRFEVNTEDVEVFCKTSDVLVISDMNTNGSRRIVRYQSSNTRFKDWVIRGGSDAELEEIYTLFPRHRRRGISTPCNIRERVQQIITLSIRSMTRSHNVPEDDVNSIVKGKQRVITLSEFLKNPEYAFQSISVLGSSLSIELGDKIKSRMNSLMSDRLKAVNQHWVDISYPLAPFYVTSDCDLPSFRMFRSDTNRAVCNGLAVLYTCVSEGLREPIVDEIARYFISRLLIGAFAFLPDKVCLAYQESYMNNYERKEGFLPISIHKFRMMIPPRQESNSRRKYTIAHNLSKTTFLDISFMMKFAGCFFDDSKKFDFPAVKN